MALIFTDGFETYNGVGPGLGVKGKWIVVGGGIVAATNLTGSAIVTGRFAGTKAFQLRSENHAGSEGIRRVIPGAGYTTATVGFACAVTPGDLPAEPAGGQNISFVNSSGGYAAGIQLDPSLGRAILFDNNGDVVTSTSVGIFNINQWHYWEFYATQDTTSADCSIWLDGQQVLNYTAGFNSGADPIVGVQFTSYGANTGGDYDRNIYDDIYMTDGSRIGELRIVALRPNADATIDWNNDNGASTNYTAVNETTPDATHFVTTNTVGDRDLYEFDNLGITPNSIYAISVNSISKKNDAGTRVLNNTIQSGGVDADGPDFYLTTDDVRYEAIYETNPDGDVPWTVTTVNAIKAGPKLKS